MPRPSTWRLRENKWRAMRYGLDAKIVVNSTGDTCPIADDIRNWLDRIQGQYAALNYQPYRETLLQMIEKGNSAKRQQMLWEATNSLEEVARFNCRELQHGKPLWEYVANEIKDKKAAEQQAKSGKSQPLTQKEAAA
jgi:glutamate---cysteine ligase / carboxylate-amine ligase